MNISKNMKLYQNIGGHIQFHVFAEFEVRGFDSRSARCKLKFDI